jgi:excisionase family DNA binding protein
VRDVMDPSDALLISVRQAATRLGIGRDATYALVRNGELPCVRVGRRVLVPASALAAWVERATADVHTAAEPRMESRQQAPTFGANDAATSVSMKEGV